MSEIQRTKHMEKAWLDLGFIRLIQPAHDVARRHFQITAENHLPGAFREAQAVMFVVVYAGRARPVAVAGPTGPAAAALPPATSPRRWCSRDGGVSVRRCTIALRRRHTWSVLGCTNRRPPSCRCGHPS